MRRISNAMQVGEGVGVGEGVFSSVSNRSSQTATAPHHLRAREVTLTREQFEAWKSWSGPQWGPFKRAWFARGLRNPPSEDMREVLWQIADARPHDLGRWIMAAPTPGKAIDYVLERWHRFVADLDEQLAVDEDARTSALRIDRASAPQALRELLR